MADNPYVFPGKTRVNTSTDPLATPREIEHHGMTLRDWFAGQALAGLLANPVAFGAYFQGNAELIATECGLHADAMLAERSK